MASFNKTQTDCQAPKTVSYSGDPICPISADGEHTWVRRQISLLNREEMTNFAVF